MVVHVQNGLDASDDAHPSDSRDIRRNAALASVDNDRNIGECRAPPAAAAGPKNASLARCRKCRFPRASRALERFTVLDLTQVRSGPTCVRQLADWGANVIKIETPPRARRPASRRAARARVPDFQNLHRNKRSMTLNLKAPEGLAAFKRMVKKADVVVENFRPDVKKRLGIDYKDLEKINPKIILGSISGFGQDGPYADAAGLRPDRAGHGRADVDHRAAGAGAGARRHPDRRPLRRPVLRARHPGGAARAREVEEGPARRDLAAAGADLHARLPGRALAGEGRGRGAGRQQSSDLDADRRVQDRRRPHQHRLDRPEDLGALLQGARRARDARESRLRERGDAARRTATRSTRRSTATP